MDMSCNVGIYTVLVCLIESVEDDVWFYMGLWCGVSCLIMNLNY